MFALIAIKEPVEPLTYRVPTKFYIKATIGSLVEVPFRNKKRLGIVLSLEKNIPKDLLEKKILSINKVLFANWLSEDYLELIKRISSYSFTPFGIVAFRLLPPILKKSMYSFGDYSVKKLAEPKRYHLLGQKLERFIAYVKLFKKLKDGQLLIVGSHGNCKYLQSIFKSHKISFKAVDSFTKTKEKIETSNDFMTGKIKVLIGTRQIIGWPAQDLKLIIIDDPINFAHFPNDQPYMDTTSIAIIRMADGINILLGFPILTPELLYAQNTNQAQKIKQPTNTLNVRFSKIGSSLLTESLKQIILSKEKTYLICPRKGMGGAIRCLDCDTLVACLKCNETLYFGKTDGECEECGNNENQITTCNSCQGHSLSSFGIGVDSYKEEISKEFGYVPGTVKIITEGEIGDASGVNIVFGFADAPLSSPDLDRPYRLLCLIKDLSGENKILVQTKLLDSVWWEVLADSQSAVLRLLMERKKYNLSPFSLVYQLVKPSNKLIESIKEKGYLINKENDIVKLIVPKKENLNLSFPRGQKVMSPTLI